MNAGWVLGWEALMLMWAWMMRFVDVRDLVRVRGQLEPSRRER
jgi:hypothetical protein